MKDHRTAIADFINKKDGKVILEIGVDQGDLGKQIKRFCPQITDFYMIDPWEVYSGNGAGTLAARTEARWEQVFANVKRFFADDSRFKILRMTSIEASKLTFPPLDFCFIDGNHDEESVREDTLTWLPKIKVGGTIAGDDWGIYPGVAEAVTKIFPKVFFIHHRVWVYTKTS